MSLRIQLLCAKDADNRRVFAGISVFRLRSLVRAQSSDCAKSRFLSRLLSPVFQKLGDMDAEGIGNTGNFLD